jgi:ABC-2 type transport system permease protein
LFACFILYSGFDSLSRIPAFTGGVDYYLGMIGMSFHYNSISRGVIDTRDLIYFLSVIILFIAGTGVSVGSRTWDTATSDLT